MSLLGAAKIVPYGPNRCRYSVEHERVPIRPPVLAIYQKNRESFAQTNINSLRAALKSYQQALTHRQRILQLDPTNQAHLEAEKTVELKISRLTESLK